MTGGGGVVTPDGHPTAGGVHPAPCLHARAWQDQHSSPCGMTGTAQPRMLRRTRSLRRQEGHPARPMAMPSVDVHSISSTHASSSFHPGHSQTQVQKGALCPGLAGRAVTSQEQGMPSGKGLGWAAEAAQGCRGGSQRKKGDVGS